ncbi:MAG: plasmid stabilization protein [Pseudomonadota bacterium]
MASLTIRNLPDDIKSKLRVQAAHNGQSLEAHARGILQKAAETSNPSVNIVETFQTYFGNDNGVDLELPSRKTARGVPDFD